MKNLFLTILLISCAYLPSRAQDKTSKEPKIKVIVEKVGWHEIKGREYFQLKVSVANISDDTQKFVNYTASYDCAFVINNSFNLWADGTRANVLRTYKLMPKTSKESVKTYELEMIPLTKHKSHFKIGFKWYKNQPMFIPLNDQKRSKENTKTIQLLQRTPDEMIWSDEVSF